MASKQGRWEKESEAAQIYGNEWDDGIDYTYDAVAEWEADVAARTMAMTSAEETNKLKSITLADANNMDIFETHASKSYPDHKYVLIGKSRIWIATKTVIEHNGEKVTLKPINFLGGKGKKKTNKKKRTNKKKTNKKKTNKKKTNKRKTSKRKTSKRKTSKRKK